MHLPSPFKRAHRRILREVAQWSAPSAPAVVPAAIDDDIDVRPRQPGLILLVEDDFLLRGALSEWLHESGYQVVCAANGVEALHRLRTGFKPSLILLDIMLPHMDGLEFRARQLRSSAIADIPVVVITAVGLGAAESERLHLPLVFMKPLDLLGLLETIRIICKPPLS